MLYNFAPDRNARDLVMNSIAPIWDGNETWLILGSLGLLAAFPVAFAIIIPAVYFPILLMLLALIFRGLAFEFRYRDAEHRTFWDHGFAAGSALGGFRPRRGARLVHPGLPGRRPPLRRRLVRLLHAVFDFLRHRLDVRLWAARRRLADHQDRGRLAGLGARARPQMPDRHGARHRRRQPVDAVDRSENRDPLVLLAAHRLSGAGADHHRGAGALCVALAPRSLPNTAPSSPAWACS